MAHVVYWNSQSKKVKRQDLTTSLDADRPKKLGGRVKADPVGAKKLSYPIDNIKGGNMYKFSGVVGNQRNS